MTKKKSSGSKLKINLKLPPIYQGVKGCAPEDNGQRAPEFTGHDHTITAEELERWKKKRDLWIQNGGGGGHL